MSNINFEKHQSPKFELTIQIRDFNGAITGKTKSFSTDDHEELDNWFQRNSGVKKVRKKKEEKKEDKKETTEN